MEKAKEFIEQNKKIKKACIWGFFLSFLLAFIFVSPILEGKKQSLNPNEIFWVFFWIISGVYCIYCRSLAVKTLEGDENAAKKMIYLIELDTKIYTFLFLLFLSVKIKQAFDKNENKILLGDILKELRNKSK